MLKIPEPQEQTPRGPRPPARAKGGHSWEQLCVARVQDTMTRDDWWRREAEQALAYYDSEQHRGGSLYRENRDRARTMINLIRTDVDSKIASVLDGELTIRPTARHPAYHSQAVAMIDMMQYSQDREMDYRANQEQCLMSFFQVGEGVIFEGWDKDAEEGLGGATSRRIDARNVLVDGAAVRPQFDDAHWIVLMSYESTYEIEERFNLSSVSPEPENLMLTQWLYPSEDSSFRNQSPQVLGDERAWVITMYHKHHDRATSYFLGDDEQEITREQYMGLPDEERQQIEVRVHGEEMLYEFSMVNGVEVEHRISPFDKSEGGHGMYPFSFYRHVTLDGRFRARGEIAFLMETNDVYNELFSSLLDQAALANTGYMDVQAGSYRPEERNKFTTMAQVKAAIIERLPGTAPAEWRGVNPTGANVYQGIMPMVEQMYNQESGRYNSQRGHPDYAGQSGRAIRSLQAAASQLTLLSQSHIENGMRRQSLLRMHNIAQFTRGTFIAEVLDPDSQEARPLYVGSDFDEIVATHRLQVAPHPTTQVPVFIDEAGQPANVLAITETFRVDEIFERIRMILDTDRKATQEDRHQIAQTIFNVVGAPALPWFAKQLDLSDSELLLQEVNKADVAGQTYKRLEEAAKQVGIDVGQLVEMMMAQFQQQPPPGGPAPGPAPPPQAALAGAPPQLQQAGA